MKHSIRLIIVCFCLAYAPMLVSQDMAKSENQEIQKAIESNPEVVKLKTQITKAEEVVAKAEIEHNDVKTRLAEVGRKLRYMASDPPEALLEKQKMAESETVRDYPELDNKKRKHNSIRVQLEGIEKYYSETKGENQPEINARLEERIQDLKAQLKEANEEVEAEKQNVAQLEKEAIKQDSIAKVDKMQEAATQKVEDKEQLEAEMSKIKEEYNITGHALSQATQELENAHKQLHALKDKLEKEMLEKQSKSKSEGNHP